MVQEFTRSYYREVHPGTWMVQANALLTQCGIEGLSKDFLNQNIYLTIFHIDGSKLL